MIPATAARVWVTARVPRSGSISPLAPALDALIGAPERAVSDRLADVVRRVGRVTTSTLA